MAEIIYLPKGIKRPKGPNTVIYVKSRGGGSFDSGSNGRATIRVLKMDAAAMIEKWAKSTGDHKVYVIGYDEAKDHAINLDHVREYISRSSTK